MTNKPMVIDPGLLRRTRSRCLQGDSVVANAATRLCAEADAFLTRGPFSVINKKFTPPSGDKHDFMSLRLYYWPNPSTTDGLPYVNRGCVRNPEYASYDRVPLGELCTAVKVLALAWYLTGANLTTPPLVENGGPSPVNPLTALFPVRNCFTRGARRLLRRRAHFSFIPLIYCHAPASHSRCPDPR
jgi:hypothetical protein